MLVHSDQDAGANDAWVTQVQAGAALSDPDAEAPLHSPAHSLLQCNPQLRDRLLRDSTGAPVPLVQAHPHTRKGGAVHAAAVALSALSLPPLWIGDYALQDLHLLHRLHERLEQAERAGSDVRILFLAASAVEAQLRALPQPTIDMRTEDTREPCAPQRLLLPTDAQTPQRSRIEYQFCCTWAEAMGACTADRPLRLVYLQTLMCQCARTHMPAHLLRCIEGICMGPCSSPILCSLRVCVHCPLAG